MAKKLYPGCKDGVFFSVALWTVQSQQSTVVEVFHNPIELQAKWPPLLFRCFWLELFWIQYIYPEILKIFPKLRIDLAIHFGAFQELWVNWWNQFVVDFSMLHCSQGASHLDARIVALRLGWERRRMRHGRQFPGNQLLSSTGRRHVAARKARSHISENGFCVLLPRFSAGWKRRTGKGKSDFHPAAPAPAAMWILNV